MKIRHILRITLPASLGLISLSLTILPSYMFISIYLLGAGGVYSILFFLPLIFSIFAIILGAKNLKIDDDDDLSKKAIILGIISIVTFVISIFWAASAFA
ncbi:MAG: hypothetical protein ACOC53_06490 [Candidatus Saliniplasma sp.]